MKLFLVLLLHGGIALAQPSGSFTATGAMTRPRQAHTATLLPDGRVLIVGGYELTGSAPRPVGLETAEVYNPETGSFAATARMSTGRYGHTATVLPDGKVLIAGGTRLDDPGGSGRNAVLSSAELYDAATDTFTPTNSMMMAREWHSATLLQDGKVLIAGGVDWQPHYSAECDCSPLNTPTAELYDPATGTFTRTGDMTAPLAGPIATLLSGGKVWIATGEDGPNFNAQLYDPRAGAFSDTGWQQGGLIPATVNLLTDGQLLVTLNVSECDFNSRKAGLYDAATGKFRDSPDMAYGICRPSGAMLSDGAVLITGGFFIVGGRSQVYDPRSGAFSITADMTTARARHTATLLRNGNVLIVGGTTGDYFSHETLASAEIYTPVVSKPAPVLFSVPGAAPAQGAILHGGTSEIASPANPAVPGEILEIYFTGLTDDGVVPPQVSIAGRSAEIVFFGKAGGYNTLNQVNVRVPGGITPGSAVPVRLTYLTRASNQVTIAVR